MDKRIGDDKYSHRFVRFKRWGKLELFDGLELLGFERFVRVSDRRDWDVLSLSFAWRFMTETECIFACGLLDDCDMPGETENIAEIEDSNEDLQKMIKRTFRKKS